MARFRRASGSAKRGLQAGLSAERCAGQVPPNTTVDTSHTFCKTHKVPPSDSHLRECVRQQQQRLPVGQFLAAVHVRLDGLVAGDLLRKVLACGRDQQKGWVRAEQA